MPAAAPETAVKMAIYGDAKKSNDEQKALANTLQLLCFYFLRRLCLLRLIRIEKDGVANNNPVMLCNRRHSQTKDRLKLRHHYRRMNRLAAPGLLS